MGTERIELEAPLDGTFHAVFRLVVAGIAEQADFGYEAMDDLQLAIERLLAETDGNGRVTAEFEIGADSVVARLGPLRGSGIARALREPAERVGEFPLARILTTVLDSYAVEELEEGRIAVRIEKLRGAARQ